MRIFTTHCFCSPFEIIVNMERLTIVRKPATAAENLYKYEVLETGEQSAENLYKYEVLETGEQFSSFIGNMASAFAEYIKDQELSEFVSSWLAECQSQEQTQPELQLEIPTYEEAIPDESRNSHRDRSSWKRSY